MINSSKEYQIPEVLGYDCDENPIFEFRVLRFPFSAYIENWDDEPNINPRFYCLVKNSKGDVFAISVYDNWNERYIRRYENIEREKEVPIEIKTVEDMHGYEVAFSGIDKSEWYYERQQELKKTVDNMTIGKNVKKAKVKNNGII